MSHLLTLESHSYVLSVFISVAGDDCTGAAGVSEYCHEFSLRAGFKTDGLTGGCQSLEHALGLVHFDGKHQKVIPAVAVLSTRAGKRSVNGAQTVSEYLGKCQQCWEALAVFDAGSY